MIYFLTRVPTDYGISMRYDSGCVKIREHDGILYLDFLKEWFGILENLFIHFLA